MGIRHFLLENKWQDEMGKRFLRGLHADCRVRDLSSTRWWLVGNGKAHGHLLETYREI